VIHRIHLAAAAISGCQMFARARPLSWSRVGNWLRMLVAVGLTALLAPTLAAVPSPLVKGPIPSDGTPGDVAHDYIFFATTHDLATQGYIEQEFFIEGTANRYTTPAGATGAIVDSGHPYRTRVVVRRPLNDKDFNGTVLVEWTNVTNGFDAENVWFFGWEHMLRAGYAWVGVSAQRVGVDRLKSWSPGRYGPLDVTQGGTITDDSLSYDIMSQAGQALRNPRGVDMLGKLKAKRFVAIGESQSAGRLATYINSVMPLGNVWDGVFLLSTFGTAIRTDLPVPVFKVLFEWDIQTGEAAVRQPDTPKFHRWEVAGTAHVDHHLRLSREPLELRDLAVSSEAVLAPQCGVPTIGSRVPNHYVVDAAIEALNKWIKNGREPATSPLFQIASFGPGLSAKIARDSNGMALGGIRLSQMEVPTAINVGDNTGPSACSRWGYHVPFDIPTLESLYPKHAGYVRDVVRVTKENHREGFILAPDANATVREARESRVGSGPSDSAPPQFSDD
jgi:hypothetical protein